MEPQTNIRTTPAAVDLASGELFDTTNWQTPRVDAVLNSPLGLHGVHEGLERIYALAREMECEIAIYRREQYLLKQVAIPALSRELIRADAALATLGVGPDAPVRTGIASVLSNVSDEGAAAAPRPKQSP